MSAQETNSSDFQQLRNELRLVMEERQAAIMRDMREVMAELMRNSGPSESSSAGGSAAVRGSPRGAEPTAAERQISAAGATTPGGGARGNTRAVRETVFRDDASCSIGVTDAEKLLFLSWFVQPGVSQIRQGGLENGGHTPAVSWE